MSAPHQPLRALYVFVGKPQDANWITTDPAQTPSMAWTSLAVSSDGSLARIREAFLRGGDLSRYDLIVSSEYYLSVGVNLRLMLTGARTPHIIWGLNQSRRLLQAPGLNWAINKIFQRASIVVTHSVEEQRLFERIHGIQAKRFRFSPWGFDLPTPDPHPFPAKRLPYVSLIGRNNRDAHTFAQAALKAGIHPVVVTSGLSQTDKTLLESQGVEIHEDLPFESCMACIRDSQFNAVLLKDASRGAGHITLVAAMMMGKAQVVSDASVIQDYVRSPEHALKVAIGNVDHCAQAFSRLLGDAALVDQMGAAARRHAQASYTNSAILENFKRIVQECVQPEDK